MKRKLLLISIGVVLGVVGSLFIPHQNTEVLRTNLSSDNVKQSVEPTPAAPAKQNLTTSPVAKPVAVSQSTPSSASSAPAVTSQPQQLDYGPDPTQPGVYIVFNKSKVMTEAGIPPEQQASANTLITDLMQWRYEVSGQEADICYIMPEVKMATVAPDYETDPVTQLTYCNKIAQDWYGGWNQALAKYEASPSYGIF